MFNPIIIIAILVQGFIARTSRMAGAITGFVITTGIFLWGLAVYADGSQISFFGIPLSESFFIFLCLVWYVFDVRGFLRARKTSGLGTGSSAILQDPAVRAIWSSTWNAWRQGQGSQAGMGEANKLSLNEFVNAYIKKTGGYMQAISTRHPFESGEFIVYATVNPAHDVSVLTDRTLYLFAKGDIQSGLSQIVPLRDIESYHFDTSGQGHLQIKLRSGQTIDQQRNAAPQDDFVSKFIPARQPA